MPLVRSIALAAFVALTSCTAPTVLRPVPEEAMEPGRTFAPSPASPIREELAGPERRAAQTASLILEEKEWLFRDFDDYPRRPSHHANTSARASKSSRPPPVISARRSGPHPSRQTRGFCGSGCSG